MKTGCQLPFVGWQPVVLQGTLQFSFFGQHFFDRVSRLCLTAQTQTHALQAKQPALVLASAGESFRRNCGSRGWL